MNPENEIIRSLDGCPAKALRLTAAALRLSGPPLTALGIALDHLALCRDHGEESDELARLQLRRAVRLAAESSDALDLLERLEGIEAPPWPQYRKAVEVAMGSEPEAVA